MVALTKFGARDERIIGWREGPQGSSRWRKLLMDLGRAPAKSSSTERRTSSREGVADGKPVPGSDANGPCAWNGRAPRMVTAGGDPAIHRPLAALQRVVASRAPRRVRRTLD